MRKTFADYIENMTKIRQLSLPEVDGFEDSVAYRDRLMENFRTIGELAEDDRDLISRVLVPFLTSEKQPGERTLLRIAAFCERLFSVGSTREGVNLDLPLMSVIMNRLIESEKIRQDTAKMLPLLKQKMFADYGLMDMTRRIYTDPKIARGYSDRGLAAGQFCMDLLEPERFRALPDNASRILALKNARFMAAFYLCIEGDDGANARYLQILERIDAVMEDPFYIGILGEDIDWRKFRFRVLEYYLESTEVDNARGFSAEQLRLFADKADEMDRLIASDPDYFSGIPGYAVAKPRCARNRYLAGRIGEREYLDILTDVYRERKTEDYSLDGGYLNVLVPLEILCVLRKRNRSARENTLLIGIYRSTIDYMFHLPNAGALSVVMGFFSEMVRCFVEIPSGIRYEGFCMQALAALHPPTYIHTQTVAQLTENLCGHLIERRPELFLGFPECRTAEGVKAQKDRIVAFACHAALCHDFGKIAIMDTIFMYGRNLLEFEYEIIRAHSRIGYDLLTSHASTEVYADIAAGHHRWYDNTAGYPETFSTQDSPYRTIIDLVTCADGMDASTDSLGRSYRKGISLEEYLAELEEGSGTRYAPWLTELLAQKDVREDIAYLLGEGRDKNYRECYLILRDVQRKGRAWTSFLQMQ